MQATNLKTNHLTQPLGIDAGTLFLSWQCAEGVCQTAYEIEVTAGAELPVGLCKGVDCIGAVDIRLFCLRADPHALPVCLCKPGLEGSSAPCTGLVIFIPQPDAPLSLRLGRHRGGRFGVHHSPDMGPDSHGLCLRHTAYQMVFTLEKTAAACGEGYRQPAKKG